MARDSLIHPSFSKLGRYNTPTYSILATMGIMIFILLAFNFSEVAKLASAFKLMIFGLLNLAVIVMRESKIEEYDPGYKSPFYPWLQIGGMLVSTILIFEMGLVSILFTVGVTVFSVGWYYYYAFNKIERHGAIYHVHARLGEYKDQGLEHEMRRILREKGLRDEDPYEVVVGRSQVLDLEGEVSYEEVIQKATALLADQLPKDREELANSFDPMSKFGAISIGRGTALFHIRLEEDVQPEMVLVRAKQGIRPTRDNAIDHKLHALIFLVSSEKHSSQHLRFLAHIAEMVDQDDFQQKWLDAKDEVTMREILHRDERFLNLTVSQGQPSERLIGKKVSDLELPGESLITLIQRDGKVEIPHGTTTILDEDKLSIIGTADDIKALKRQFE
jgi:mannitol/fructose-specific phosphotransferase system IIA component (Ntr-type)